MAKETPRQKMINLMYLIFIAMLALNMSKEVLNAFGMMNENMNENNMRAEKRNENQMAQLAQKAEEQPKQYKESAAKAQKLSQLGDDLVSYIESVKTGMKEGVDKEDNGTYDYVTMDKSNYLDQRWFKSGKISDDGQKLVNKIDSYRNGVLNVVEDPTLRKEVKTKFDTDPVKREGGKQAWLKYNYEGFPLIASLTKLTSLQSQVKTTESEVIANLFSGELKSAVSMSNYEAIVVPSKSAFFAGENFEGKVVLGKVDKNLSFENVVINGEKVEAKEKGQVVLDMPAGNVGERKIEGKLQFKQADTLVDIPIDYSYNVIPKPNSAVISADKMNVVYRGVQNPMTISIPGINKVNANAPGLRSAGGNGNYVMNVTNVKAGAVNINVSGELPTGKSVSFQKKFRIKEIPGPTGAIRGQTGKGGPIRMQRRGLKISSISAIIPDFDFDINIRVTGFKFQVPGNPIVQVGGTKLNGAAKNALREARAGDFVQIFDIQAKLVGNSSYRLPSISPISVQLKN
jgi:gliding motility-associated protein GldM